MRLRGFTLSELLIAIAILGVIAAFAISKIIQAQNEAQRITTFRESIAAVQDVLYQGVLSGQIIDNSNITNYFLSKINSVKECRTNANTEGCWPQSTNPFVFQIYEPGIVLSTGATIGGFNSYSCSWGGNNVILDWNGKEPPNTFGDDQIGFIMWTCAGTSNSDNSKTGKIEYWTGSSTTLSQEIWQ